MSFLKLCLGLWICCCFAVATAWAEDPPSLHQRVDALIEAAAVGPLAPAASDADFVRRVHLDLTGMIPTAAETRAFLADGSADKRTRLIDQLLDSPRFARNMSLTFDVMLMERRPDKAIKTPEWQAYLRKSFDDNKQLDQLCRELLVADGADETLRPAARFLLDRDSEPNVVTRDAGRMLFGMDLQCAQCHDHPVIDDYLQEDYYGLYAFFLRSSVFTDAKKKQAQLAEKADGEANFKSVFTGNAADRVTPRLPHGATAVAEPVFNKGEEYVVAPAKDVRAVPKHSRRAQLAAILTDSVEFRRNVANRVWAHLFGRGIVHPVDAHHLANPPSHPELLELIADEFARSKYNVKWLLRELALTHAYQRTCEPLAPTAANLPPASQIFATLTNERGPKEQSVKEREAALLKAKTDLRMAHEEFKKQQLALAPLEAELKTAQEALSKSLAAVKPPTEALAKKQQQATAVADAAKKAEEAAKLLAEDKVLAQAAASIATRSQAINGELEAAKKVVADLKTQTELATQRVTASTDALANARQALPNGEHLVGLERAVLELQQRAVAERYQLAALERRISLAQAIGEFQEKSQSDANAAGQVWPGLIDRWAIAGQLAPLRPLSCEQFALSLLQATGVVQQQQQTAQAALEKNPPESLKNATEADRPRVLTKLIEEQAFEKVRGNLNAFVGLYGTQPGADFQATVNQALFFENGSMVQGLFGASGSNLTGQLAKMEDAGMLAEELYLSTLTRFPSEEERQDVANYLKDRAADRAVAVGELVWALLSSNEFRFNH
ncbi:MAG TPA: DUF1549 domain-containing protein [Pirellulaceae bacterium]|nr:DUF1549 domain-containing protein [Pirellulaceae bacterium]